MGPIPFLTRSGDGGVSSYKFTRTNLVNLRHETKAVTEKVYVFILNSPYQ
jgi:hypothetical protein